MLESLLQPGEITFCNGQLIEVEGEETGGRVVVELVCNTCRHHSPQQPVVVHDPSASDVESESEDSHS
nr:hypothetical protein [uncultured archaeon]